MTTRTRDGPAERKSGVPVVALPEDARAGRGDERDQVAPAALRRGGPRRLRRAARSYLRLTAHTCSALIGYGLALLLGFTPLSTLLGALDLLQAHPRLALGITVGGFVLALGATLVLGKVEVRPSSRSTARERVARAVWLMLRAALGSTLTTLALRYVCGLEPLPSASPLAQLADEAASLLAALLATLGYTGLLRLR